MKRRLVFGLAGAMCAFAQAPQPDGAGLRTGTFSAKWITGGPDCAEVPAWQVHQYNPDLYVLRESGCTHYEKPFLYLIFGKDKAMLQDTGSGASPGTGKIVATVIKEWLLRNKRESIPLIVMHSHSHGDHKAGDADFGSQADVTVVPLEIEATQKFYGITKWPEDTGAVDLGGRVLDVIPIPGHDVLSIALYDRQTGLLFTGDSLYPGRLYVADLPAYAASMQRLVKFTEDKPVSHVLGCHIEQSSTPFLDYPVGTKYQPAEHELPLSRAHLLELDRALQSMDGKPVRVAFRDFTVWPKPPQRRPSQ